MTQFRQQPSFKDTHDAVRAYRFGFGTRDDWFRSQVKAALDALDKADRDSASTSAWQREKLPHWNREPKSVQPRPVRTDFLEHEVQVFTFSDGTLIEKCRYIKDGRGCA